MNFKNNLILETFKIDFSIAASYKFEFIISLFSIVVNSLILFLFSSQFSNQSNVEAYSNLNFFSFFISGVAVFEFSFVIIATLGSKMRHLQLIGVFEELLQNHKNFFVAVASFAFYPLIRSLVKVILYLIIGMTFFDIDTVSIISLILIVATLITCSISLIGIGFCAAAFSIYFKQSTIIPSVYSFLALFFSGIAFPKIIINDYLENLSYALPTSHALEIIRQLLKSYDVDVMIFHLAYLIALAFIFFLIGIISLKMSIKLVKLDGSAFYY